MKRVLATLLMIAVYMGCASVPDVMFVRDGDEGGTEIDAGGGIEAGPTLCGTRELPPNTTCCGEVACAGNACTSDGKCKNSCHCLLSEICCRRGGGGNETVSCVATAADCL